MNRKNFIKTLVLGTGVLSAGVSLAESKPEPKTTGYTLSELLAYDNVSVSVWKGKLEGKHTLYIRFQDKDHQPQDRITISDITHPTYDTFGRSEDNRYITVHFNTLDELGMTMNDIRKKYLSFEGVKYHKPTYAFCNNVIKHFYNIDPSDVNMLTCVHTKGEYHTYIRKNSVLNSGIHYSRIYNHPQHGWLNEWK